MGLVDADGVCLPDNTTLTQDEVDVIVAKGLPLPIIPVSVAQRIGVVVVGYSGGELQVSSAFALTVEECTELVDIARSQSFGCRSISGVSTTGGAMKRLWVAASLEPLAGHRSTS
jgi:hypothetical protein